MLSAAEVLELATVVLEPATVVLELATVVLELVAGAVDVDFFLLGGIMLV